MLGVETPDADYLKGYLSDIGHTLSAPARMNAKDWLLAASLIGGIVALQNADGRLRHDVQSSRSQSHDSLADFARVFGSGRHVYPGLVAAWSLGAALDDGRLRETALLGFESVLLSGQLCDMLKLSFGRARPGAGLGPDEWDGFGSDRHSMPSGHTTMAFALATAVHLEYRNKWVSTVVYSLAALTAWSRLNDDAHWASDVAAGAALGTLVTCGIHASWFRRTW